MACKRKWANPIHDVNGKILPTYSSWQHMTYRIDNDPEYAHLDMDPRWRNYDAFVADMGQREEGTSIERRNNGLGYWPDNCYWGTPFDQARNRRSSVLTEDETAFAMLHEYATSGRTMADVAAEYGVTEGHFSNILHGRYQPRVRQRYDTLYGGDVLHKVAQNQQKFRGGPKRRKLTRCEIQEARKLRKQGVSFVQIGARFGVHATTVYRSLKDKRYEEAPVLAD